MKVAEGACGGLWRRGTLAAVLIVTACSQEAEVAEIVPPKQAEVVTPESIDQSLGAADAYLSAGRLDEAQAILQVLAAKAPGEARAHESLALVHIARAHEARQRGDAAAWREQTAAAYEAYKRAIACFPGGNHPGLHQSAGEVAHTLGQLDEALAHYTRAGEIDARNVKHSLYAAQIYLERERWADARRELRRAMTLDPEEPLVRASLAQVELGTGNLPAALDQMTKARAGAPNDVGLRARHAAILRRADRPREALELLVGLSATERAQEFVAQEIAECYRALDLPMDAARAWQHCHAAMVLSPRAWYSAVQVGRCLLEAGEREQAYLWLEQAKQSAADNEDIRALEGAIAASEAPPD
jgi:tetratricopeptide (TPR) repeat protein